MSAVVDSKYPIGTVITQSTINSLVKLLATERINDTDKYK